MVAIEPKKPAQTLLLSGFRPFGGDSFNPSQAIAESLNGHWLSGDVVVRSVVLPVSGPAGWNALRRQIRRFQPEWIVSLGLSSRNVIHWETKAWNEQEYRIPDEAGLQPKDTPVLKRGPAVYDSRLYPPMKIPSGGGEGGMAPVPVEPSQDPGRFVCNHLYYRLLRATADPRHSAAGRALFLHLPATVGMDHPGSGTRVCFELNLLQQTVLGLLEHLVNPRKIEKSSLFA